MAELLAGEGLAGFAEVARGHVGDDNASVR
jgi:hypothetical protein